MSKLAKFAFLVASTGIAIACQGEQKSTANPNPSVEIQAGQADPRVLSTDDVVDRIVALVSTTK